MRRALHHLPSSSLLHSPSPSPSLAIHTLQTRSCTLLARPLVCAVQPKRGMAVKRKPLSSLELKIKADIVERTKHEISKTKNPTAAMYVHKHF